ncbi:hypothetical protein KAW38_02615 [Candidatus Micrarchaeota archaeon]|nr:hypothetical protein [Candidatus Micrarchaeota archaeon]
MKRMIFVLLLFGFFFANTVGDTVNGYYLASYNEDIDVYMGYMDVLDLTDEEVQTTRELTLGIFSAYNTEEYMVTDLEHVVDGKYALAQYELYAKISGAESVEYTLDYVMLLHNIMGDWKIVFVMPLDDYLESSNQIQIMAIADDMLETEHEAYQEEPSEDPVVYFDDEPMSDLEYELDDSLYSCTTDAYCQKNNLGNVCAAGTCAFAQLPDDRFSGCCGSIFILLGVLVFAVLKN